MFGHGGGVWYSLVMDESGNTVAKRRDLLGRWVDRLCTVRAAIWIPVLIVFVPLILIWFELSDYSHGPGWQVSGSYYRPTDNTQFAD